MKSRLNFVLKHSSDLKKNLLKTYSPWFDELFYGIETDDGWIPLLNELCKKLKNLNFNGKVTQVKEKFGGLRFYVSSATNEQDEIINIYEKLSYSVCERCGRNGHLRKNGWFRTLCNEHEKEYQDEQKKIIYKKEGNNVYNKCEV